jgi:arabinan endo-1,5-alpha-L-arabinosidase
LLGSLSLFALLAAEPELLQLTGDLRVHDPVLIKEGDTYYVFSTGGGRQAQGVIPIRTSKDMRNWTLAGYVFESLPEWAKQEIPKARGAWAPDISFYNGRYHLYYSVSSFGVNTSAIGLATNKTLNPASPDYKWTDEGMVVRSRPESTDWNAIDPNLVIEDDTNVWLTWGSFWGGIQMHRIDPATGKFSTADTRFYPLCSRERSPPVKGSVEAPFIIRRDGWWYLFVSYDFCCRGPKSDYKVVVGRSRKVTGPYLDKAGKSLNDGGGTLVVEAATQSWHGAGHNAVYSEGGVDYLVFHSYPEKGSQLFISTMVWEDGWPRVAKMP